MPWASVPSEIAATTRATISSSELLFIVAGSCPAARHPKPRLPSPSMDSTALRELQAPLKQRYRDEPDAAIVTLKASGKLGEGISCSVDTGRALAEAGLHPATGGDGPSSAPATCCSRRWRPAPG